MSDKVIVFNEGIPGFEALKKFVLLEEEGSQFFYLQSIEEEGVCFVVINPFDFTKAYKPNINESYFVKLGGGETSEFAMYTILTVGKTLEDTTVNLQAPVLIHVEQRKGVQAIVDDNHYSRRTKLIELMKERG